jgi:hypothetical protein
LGGAESSISKEGVPYPVYHALKHYHQHVGTGSVRVDTTADLWNLLYTTAFVNKPSKKLSNISINADSSGQQITYN